MSAGNWSNAANAGVFYRNLNNNRSNDNNNAGFCAADYSFKPDTTKVDTGAIGITSPAQAKYAEGATANDLPLTLETIAREDILYQAFLNARKGKRNKRAIYLFENNLSKNLAELKERILSNEYLPDAPRKFMVTEPKPREISAPSFRDSVVQHAIYLVVYPTFDRSFIKDNYGCRKYKGAHKASDALQNMMREHSNEDYYVQMDIKKYYYSIKHSILKQRIERKIEDERLVELMMRFAGTGGNGLYIGNLLAQLYGLIHLDWLDHFAKRVMKVKYVRYVDDFVVVGLKTYEEAKEVLRVIEEFLRKKLALEFSKWRIAKIKKGINFVGFRTWKSTRYVRKRSLHNFSKALKKNKLLSLVSIVGNAKRTATHAYFQNQLKQKGIAL